MRIMGVMVDGKHQSGAPEALIGEAPNSFVDGELGQKMQDRLNSYWNDFTNHWSRKQ